MKEPDANDESLLAKDLHVQATYRLTEALVEAENRMRRRIELLKEIVFETDPAGALVFLNGAWAKTMGRPLDQCLGLPLSQFAHEADRPAIDSLLRGKSPSPPATLPRIRLLRLDLAVVWMEISATALTSGGAVGALHDVTAEKRAQDELAKLSLVASNTDNLVIITDKDGLTEWVNPAFTRRTGYTLGDMLGRKPGSLLQGPGTDLEIVAQVRDSIAAGRSFKAELLNYTRTGESYWVSFQISPIRDAQGHVERFVSIQSDSTEIRNARRELESAKERAEQLALKAMAANQAKTEFLATMSHEIRTPMNGILGMTELLQQTALTAHQRDLTDTVALSGQALLRIINDILDFSKIEAGQMSLSEEEFDLPPLVQGIVNLVAVSGHAKKVSVQSSCEANVPHRLRGDPGRLRQVLLNLVGNGLKFTNTGSVTLNVRLLETEANRAWLRFEVTDTGIGIPADKIPLLFQPFQQVDASPSRRHGGTGLGLAISRRLVQMMGGRMGVKSVEGKGSTFWFEVELPLPSAPPALVSPATAEKKLPRGLRVLVAENQEIHRRLCVLCLQKLGCTVDTAATVSDLFQRASRDRHDAIVFDTQLPGLTPGCLVSRLKESDKFFEDGVRPLPRLIDLVASATSPENESWLAAGVHSTLVKPPSMAQIKQALL